LSLRDAEALEKEVFEIKKRNSKWRTRTRGSPNQIGNRFQLSGRASTSSLPKDLKTVTTPSGRKEWVKPRGYTFTFVYNDGTSETLKVTEDDPTEAMQLAMSRRKYADKIPVKSIMNNQLEAVLPLLISEMNKEGDSEGATAMMGLQKFIKDKERQKLPRIERTLRERAGQRIIQRKIDANIVKWKAETGHTTAPYPLNHPEVYQAVATEREIDAEMKRSGDYDWLKAKKRSLGIKGEGGEVDYARITDNTMVGVLRAVKELEALDSKQSARSKKDIAESAPRWSNLRQGQKAGSSKKPTTVSPVVSSPTTTTVKGDLQDFPSIPKDIVPKIKETKK